MSIVFIQICRNVGNLNLINFLRWVWKIFKRLKGLQIIANSTSKIYIQTMNNQQLINIWNVSNVIQGGSTQYSASWSFLHPWISSTQGVHGRPKNKKTPVETCFLLFCSYHNPVVFSSWWNKFASLMGGGSDSLRQEPERTTNQTWQQSRDQASSRLFKAEWGEPVNTDCAAIANIVVVWFYHSTSAIRYWFDDD